MKHLVFVAGALAVSASLSAGCSTDSDKSSGSTTSVSEDAFVETLTGLVCDPQFECSCDGVALGATLEDCRADFTAEWQAFADDAKAEGLIYGGACVGEAVDWTRSLGCTTYSELPSDFESACSYCDYYHGEVPLDGICRRIRVGTREVSDCAAGLACLGGSCIDPCAPAPLGGYCESVECAPGLYCDHQSDPTNPTCKEARLMGESCADGTGCTAGTSCDSSTQTCTGPKPEGSACTFGECQEPLVCGAASTCVKLVAVGDSCTMADCELGLSCTDGLCVARLPSGSPCELAQDCLSANCDLGVCVASSFDPPYICVQ